MKAFHLGDIPYILAVYDEKSISRAAEKCFISQPALSKLVKKFEDSLGLKLFDRSTLPLGITEEGQTVCHYHRELMDTTGRLSRFCREQSEKGSRKLTIAAPAFFCTYILPPVIAAFAEKAPWLAVRAVEANDDDIAAFLKADFADIGISANELSALGFAGVLWREEELVLAVPEGFAVNKKLRDYALSREALLDADKRNAAPYVSIAAFADEPFLLLREGNDSRERIMQIFSEAGLTPKVSLEADQLQTAYYMSMAGQGISFVRTAMARYTAGTGGLLYYKIDSSRSRRPIRIYYEDLTRLDSGQREFLSFLRDYPLEW